MSKTGWVTLVGAGPGNPDLLTLGGKKAIEQAEVVLYDRLVGDGILDMISDEVELIDVGKESNHHKVPQKEINKLLLEYAKAGKNVLRLKGGDGFLFGRGGEELEDIRKAGIPFTVIPGITSALAVPAFGGIPVTHRDYTSSVHIITGHGQGNRTPMIPYAELVKLKGTLVFLMGVSALKDICQGLLTAGMAKEMPIAIIERGTTAYQRKIVSTLEQAPKTALTEQVKPPAIVIVGKVVELHQDLEFTPFLPLWGSQVLIVSSSKTGGRFADKLKARGCFVTEHSCLHLEPVLENHFTGSSVKDYQWILFTSAFGVECFFNQLRQDKIDIRTLSRLKVGAIGRMTAAALEQYGVYPDYIPTVFDGKAFADGICERVAANERVLLYRAKGGTPEIPALFKAQKIIFDDVVAYQTIYQNNKIERIIQKLEKGDFDLITFTSTSGVEGFAASMDKHYYQDLPVLCIGKQTALAAQKYGMKVYLSSEATVDSMVDWILNKFGGNTHGRENITNKAFEKNKRS